MPGSPLTADAVAVDPATGRRSFAFRPDVEGLRAVAILAVVGYHVGLPFFSGGFVGVDVFFVISGFLITGLLVQEATRPVTSRSRASGPVAPAACCPRPPSCSSSSRSRRGS